jgi:epoxyqueuosine reductase
VDLAVTLRKTAEAIGLVGFGVCSVEPFFDVRSEMERRVESGLADSMRFTYRDPVAATEVGRTYPWARRLITVAHAYLPAAGDPGLPVPGTGRVARFATEDHYRPLRAGLGALADRVTAAGYRSATLVDDHRMVDRAAAVRSGIAWWGRSTMVLAPRYGPWLLLGSVVTDAPLEATEPMRRDCGSCTACLPACPTGALDEGVLDARRCLAYLLQAQGPIPHRFRAAVGDRFYGCDDCLDACPPGQRLAESAPQKEGRVDLVGILEASDQALLERFEHFYIPKRRANYLRRNALVALGNSGGPDAVAIVAGFLSDPDPLLRSHAAWALGRLGGPDAVAALRGGATLEKDADVADEIGTALGTLR